MIDNTTIAALAGVAAMVVAEVAVFAYCRRPVRSTLTVHSTMGYRRGMLVGIDIGTSKETALVRRVLNGNTLAIDPYRGWRKAAHRTQARLRHRWQRVVETVYGWFERDDDD